MWLRSREARATSAACRLTVTGLSVQATRPRALDNRADLPNGRQPAAPASSEWFSRLLVSLRPAVNLTAGASTDRLPRESVASKSSLPPSISEPGEQGRGPSMRYGQPWASAVGCAAAWA